MKCPALEGIKTTWFAESERLAQQIQQQIGQTIGNALANGFQAAFAAGGNIGTGIKALMQSVLSGLGSIFMEIGEKALAGMAFIQKISAAIASMNPWVGIPAALGLIALGAVMKGSGGSGGAGSSYGGSYSSSGNTIVDRGLINPLAPTGPVTSPSNIAARPTTVLQATIIGVNDPTAQRQLQEMINKANRRGGIA